MANIVIVSGSPWKGTRLQGIVEHTDQFLRAKNFNVQQLQVADLPAEDLMYANFKSEAIIAANAQIEAADAVIIASPVYKASFTGLLKTFLDLLPQNGLEHKITLPLMIGGTISHLLAIDYSLKPVLSALGAETIIKGVYTIDESVIREDDGSLTLKQEVIDRLDHSLEKLVAALQHQTYANV